MKRKEKLVFMGVLAACLASCSKDEVSITTESTATPIELSIQIAADTRADAFGTTFKNGDMIGVYAVTHGTPLAASGNWLDNALFVYNAGSGKWTFVSDPNNPARPTEAVWPTDGTKLDFYAYYPYNSSTPSPLTIGGITAPDQSIQQNMDFSNLMNAVSTNSNSGYGKGNTVALTFRHAFASVELTIPLSIDPFGPNDNLVVSLKDIIPMAVMNLNNAGDANAGVGLAPLVPGINELTNIKMNATKKGRAYVYRALIPAQTIAAGNYMFTLTNTALNQSKASAALTAPLILRPGQTETFSLSLGELPPTVDPEIIIDDPTGIAGEHIFLGTTSTGDAALQLTKSVGKNGLYFKFGGIIGIAGGFDADQYNASYVKFNPTSQAMSDNWASIPSYTSADYGAGLLNVSAANYHTVANIAAGKGDPCKLVGYTLQQITTLLGQGTEPDNKQWRLPTQAENVSFGSQKYTWTQSGATFNGVYLSAAGFWQPTSVGALIANITGFGYYWTSEPKNSTDGNSLMFATFGAAPDASSPYGAGLTVRCVRQ